MFTHTPSHTSTLTRPHTHPHTHTLTHVHTHTHTPSHTHTHTHTLSADVEWKSVAYGAPCIQLMKETTDHNSPFNIKIVIAEVESGETQILGDSSL